MLREQPQRAPLILHRLRLPVLLTLGKDLVHLFRSLSLALYADDLKNSFHDVQMDEVAFLDQGDRSAALSFRTAVSDDRSCGCAGESAVCDQRNRSSELLVRGDSLRCVEHFRHTGCFGTLVSDENGIPGIYSVMKDRVNAFLLAVERSRVQNRAEHLFRAGGVLDDSAFRCQISLEDRDRSVCSDCLVERSDDIFLCDMASVSLIGLVQPALASLVESVLLQLFQICS